MPSGGVDSDGPAGDPEADPDGQQNAKRVDLHRQSSRNGNWKKWWVSATRAGDGPG
jgi:hypothetical protein